MAAPAELKLDDEWAKTLGMDSLEALKAAVRGQVEQQYGMQTRQKVKRQLLDALDKQYAFDLPPTLVDQEFEIIWRQVASRWSAPARPSPTRHHGRGRPRRVSQDRRAPVRLGLVLSKIGEENKIQVTEAELQRALIERARQFPGQERQVFEFYRKDPNALASLQAPVFEEKSSTICWKSEGERQDRLQGRAVQGRRRPSPPDDVAVGTVESAGRGGRFPAVLRFEGSPRPFPRPLCAPYVRRGGHGRFTP